MPCYYQSQVTTWQTLSLSVLQLLCFVSINISRYLAINECAFANKLSIVCSAARAICTQFQKKKSPKSKIKSENGGWVDRFFVELLTFEYDLVSYFTERHWNKQHLFYFRFYQGLALGSNQHAFTRLFFFFIRER